MMRLLPDTQVFLFVVTDSKRLGTEARRILENADSVYIFSASIWEIAIKARLGKIDADPEAMLEAVEKSGFEELPVLGRHAAAVARLPLHHRDPFDRLLIAQATTEQMRFLTTDEQLPNYSDLVTRI